MRTLWLVVLILLLAVPVMAQKNVKGYYRQDGTYVQPHVRSTPNNTVRDNYDYKGNVNPYTGQTGSNYYRDNPSSGYYGGSKPFNND